MRIMVMVAPLIHELLRKRHCSNGTCRPRRTKYLWANMVMSEQEDRTPVIEG
ncbi:MAG: hypothetical protein HOE76_05855 [Euryarchaeota archaeon]|nr:hypothetical protein [Euryarchaeota archaeon]MBT4982688.1 hypothetical protein [Euryarchaeota archaeon]MBT5185152.1 hypothetical protein [Euryarchaeota archaeon]